MFNHPREDGVLRVWDALEPSFEVKLQGSQQSPDTLAGNFRGPVGVRVVRGWMLLRGLLVITTSATPSSMRLPPPILGCRAQLAPHSLANGSEALAPRSTATACVWQPRRCQEMGGARADST